MQILSDVHAIYYYLDDDEVETVMFDGGLFYKVRWHYPCDHSEGYSCEVIDSKVAVELLRNWKSVELDLEVWYRRRKKPS